MNISTFLATVTEPDRPAIITPGVQDGCISFRALDELSSRLAEGFFCSGLHEGDRVIVLSPLSIRLYAALIALFKLGAAAVFLDPQAGLAQLERTAASVQAHGLICSRRVSWLRYFLPSLRRIPRLFVPQGVGTNSLARLADEHTSGRVVYNVGDDAPALITFTGGSTDIAGPRGVMRTHGLLSAQHLALSRALPGQAGDVDMTAFPIVTLHNLASGISTVIPDLPFRRPEAVEPARLLDQIAAFGVTTASGPPAFWAAIARHCLRSESKLPLRRIATGGAVASRALIRQLRHVAPSAEILIVYGSTEAEPVAVLSGAEYTAWAGTRNGIPLGRQVPGIGVRILDEEGNDQAAGSVGELWVSGAHVAQSYFGMPDGQAANKRLEANGRVWHGMGDLGLQDASGMLWLCGRVNTAVIRDGGPLYPAPIEELATTLPFVRRAGFFGVPDGLLGQRSILAVEFTDSRAVPRDWVRQLKMLCAARGWPVDEVRSIRRLPVDARHNSRIDYRRLSLMIART